MTIRTQENPRLTLPGGGHLQGTLSHRGEPGDRVLVYVHGFGSVRGGEKAAALEAACARRGWTFAAFDFRGHGESSGTMPDLCGALLLEDLEAIDGYLRGRGIRWFCPVGSSMGGWAAAWFSLRHPDRVPACVLMAPAFDFPRSLWDRLNESQRRAWEQTGRLRVHNDWVDTEIGYSLMEGAAAYPLQTLVGGWRTRLLIFHGMKDEVVPFARTVAVVEQMAYPHIEVRLIKNGDHRLLEFREEMAEAACEFFDRHIP
jgi:uncharacterized protein